MKYNFDINDRAFNAIKNKTKRVEIRTTKLGENHFDYGILKSGDEIEFKSYDGEIINCLVGDVNHYDSIEELLAYQASLQADVQTRTQGLSEREAHNNAMAEEINSIRQVMGRR